MCAVTPEVLAVAEEPLDPDVVAAELIEIVGGTA